MKNLSERIYQKSAVNDKMLSIWDVIRSGINMLPDRPLQ